MTILTISTEHWIPTHLARWLRTLRAVMPGVDVGVLVVGAVGRVEIDGCTVRQVMIRDAVACGPGDPLRWFDRERLRLGARFGVSEYLYSDPDVDWLRPGDDLPGLAGPAVSAVPAPGGPYVNNGFLYVRRDVTAEYDAAEPVQDDPRQEGWRRFAGLAAARPDLVARLPYRANVIWWDVAALADAQSVHFCNAMGKRLRPHFRYAATCPAWLSSAQEW